MPANRFVVGTAVVAAILPLLPGVVASQDQLPVLLKLKSRLGDSYSVESQTTTSNTIQEKGVDNRIAIKSTMRTTVEAVRPDGRMTLRRESRILRFWLRVLKGKELAEFDSDNPAHREAARTNPEGAPFLATLDKTFTITLEVEPTGELRRFQHEGEAPNPMLEQFMTQGAFLLLDRPVRVDDEWDGGNFSIPLAGFGRLDIKRRIVFDSIGVRDNEKVAYLKSSGAVTVKPDEDSDATAELKNAKSSELYALALERGRVTAVRGEFSATVSIVQSGEQMTLRIESKSLMKEQK